jgi:hypothetical protein
MPKTPDFYNPLIEELESYVPDSLTTCLPKESQNSFRDKVNGYNSRVLKQYIKTEEAHLIMQKKIAIIIAVGVFLQIIAFNVIMFFVVLKDFDAAQYELMLDFLKYYIGAVVVELLGLCAFIVRSVYKTTIGQLAEHIIKQHNNTKQ